MNSAYYPMLLVPDEEAAPWAGTGLQQVFGRTPTAISRELSPRHTANRIANGTFAGQPLGAVIDADPRGMVNPRFASGEAFPIRCSFLDVGRRTALEVHPADHLANSPPDLVPRTKAWYVVAASPEATVTAGIKQGFSRHLVASRIGDPRLWETLQHLPSEPGDAYYLAPGKVHALSAGNLVFVVEEDVGDTLLVCDWGDPDAPRSAECRTDLDATRSIYFQDRTLARIRGEASQVPRNRKLPIIQHCPFFAVDEWRLVATVHERTHGQSFHLVTAVEGDARLAAGKVVTELPAGRSCFVPAGAEYYTIEPAENFCRVLRTTLRTA